MFARGREIENWVGTLAVLCLAAIALISAPPSFSNASRPVRGITNPVLAMEVVRDVAEVDTILSDAPSADREVMRLKQYADFGFIACYMGLFVAMAGMLGESLSAFGAALGLLAGVCDVLENLAILRILNVSLSHTTQAMIDAIRHPSQIKWTLASLAMGVFAVLLLRQKNTGLLIVGALDLTAALLGLYGTVDNRSLAWAGIPMLGGFLTLAILYFRPFYVYRRRA